MSHCNLTLTLIEKNVARPSLTLVLKTTWTFSSRHTPNTCDPHTGILIPCLFLHIYFWVPQGLSIQLRGNFLIIYIMQTTRTPAASG